MSRKIKSEKIYVTQVMPGQEEEVSLSDGILQSINEYDASGNLLLETSFNVDGSIIEKNEYGYDPSGRMVSTVIYSEDDDPLETRKMYWDNQGNMTREEIIYMDSSVDTIDHHYEQNVLKEKIQTTEDGDVEIREEFEYEGNNLILYEKYDEENRLVYQHRNTYEQGLIKETRIFSEENDEPFRQVIHYNEKGRRMEDLTYDKRDRLISRSRYEEDEAGRVALIVEENASRKNTTQMSYNEKDLLIRQVVTDMNGQEVSNMERSYAEDGRIESTRVKYLDRMTATLQESLLRYEYEFYD